MASWASVACLSRLRLMRRDVLLRRFALFQPAAHAHAAAGQGAKPDRTASVDRDFKFLTAALRRRRELADRYDMDKADGRTALEKAEAVAARVGLKLPAVPPKE
ncbi:hypothetical protein KFE25_010813 [Diacronema lutheri]|uniref:Uncharacterized protein n=1 Tax=Diacronema lutheri TaxID=2081491 RepID=A0A8J5X6Y5_DIALT|nr:hypothetical protein KFE25_010813 [Diacronema lutheri]|mmetsp:Transcript_921/g.2912  ORF Transcript_921/g.2912 Transcript_921/m.2912 type:complete len:104 (-) Transcript_921:110-421(-)